MKRIEIKKEIRIVLELTEIEANTLKGLIQNPITNNEEECISKFRSELFNLLDIEAWDR
ncbi:MAG TPA: hypothetical protein VMW50_03380 [Dehalococcoidia bacterium]|nr:hypothetical protein [Dehalococcoidia bacterium]